MARWIVAGVLLAVLIALIVVDTSSMQANVPSGQEGTSATAAAPTASAGSQAPATAPANPELPNVVEVREKLDTSCAKVKEAIRAAKGDAYTVALGDAILTKTTEDEFAKTCEAVAGLPVDQQVAKLEALAGGPVTP